METPQILKILIDNTLKSLKMYKKFFMFISITIFLLNIFTPFIIQLIITGGDEIVFGYGIPPNDIQYGEAPANPMLWIAIRYDQYFRTVNPIISGDTYWIIIYDSSTLLLSIASALITGLVFTRLKYFLRLSKNRCLAEKGGTVLGTTLTVLGFSTLATSAISCPSCGFTAFMTLAAVLVSAYTGSLLGISALYTTLMNTLLMLGILLNLGIIIYLDSKMERLRFGGSSS